MLRQVCVSCCCFLLVPVASATVSSRSSRQGRYSPRVRLATPSYPHGWQASTCPADPLGLRLAGVLSGSTVAPCETGKDLAAVPLTPRTLPAVNDCNNICEMFR